MPKARRAAAPVPLAAPSPPALFAAPSYSVIFSGSRDWTDTARVERSLGYVAAAAGTRRVRLIAGECRGLDSVALEAAEKRGWTALMIPANWTRYGRRAGPLRNGAMLKIAPGAPVHVFHDNPLASLGTRDMVRQALESGHVVLWWAPGESAPRAVKTPTDFV